MYLCLLLVQLFHSLLVLTHNPFIYLFDSFYLVFKLQRGPFSLFEFCLKEDGVVDFLILDLADILFCLF
jgi:hypothetical protein